MPTNLKEDGKTNNNVDVNNVLVGMPLAGGIWVSTKIVEPAAYPVDATTPLDPEVWQSVGYIGEDGVSESIDKSIEKIRAWGGDTVRTIQKEHDLTYKFKFLESYKKLVLQLIHGADNVGEDDKGNFHVDITSDVLPKLSWCIQMTDGDKAIRVFIPLANITENGEINYVHSDVIAYEVTLEAFPESTAQFKARKFIGNVVEPTPSPKNEPNLEKKNEHNLVKN